MIFIFLLSFSYYSFAFDQTVYAGQIHYSRIPSQYWQHRILMIKAMGLNYLSVSVFWNFHQSETNIFDFTTDRKNLTRFLEFAKQQGMSVLLRPGPYTGGFWDFGGIPYWILANTTAIRSTDIYFMDRTKIYFIKLNDVLKPYYKSVIKLIQIQSDYGSFGTDQNYIRQLVQIWNSLQTGIQFYSSDKPQLIKYGHYPGLNIGIIEGLTNDSYDQAKKIQSNVFIFSSQVYDGWFTNWGDEQFSHKNSILIINQFKWLLDNNHSFSMYMAAGGTNFDFSAGCQMNENYKIIDQVINSFDFDSPINEHGNHTLKYDDLKRLLSQYIKWPIPDIPDNLPFGTIPTINPSKYSSFQQIKLDWFQLPIYSQNRNYTGSWSFQQNKLSWGYGLYKFFPLYGQITLNFGYSDQAVVYIDDVFIKKFYRGQNGTISYKCQTVQCKIVIVIESLGHQSQGKNLDYKKGLFWIKTNIAFTNLEMKTISLKYQDISDLQPSNQTVQGGMFYKSQFNLKPEQLVDTYLSLNNYGSGYVWINGNNLGRYWNIGPQKNIYCPGVWLKQTSNVLIVLDVNVQLLYYGTIQSFPYLYPPSFPDSEIIQSIYIQQI